MIKIETSGLYDNQTNHFYNIPDFMMKKQQDLIDFLKKQMAELEKKVSGFSRKSRDFFI
ncbi:MAG: hypothetical protein LBT29_05845 [Flavobacteriaceae bacterium]|nr:hypothetical protein [Flavobacteriaceae bacterium]